MTEREESCNQNWEKFVIALTFWLAHPETNEVPKLSDSGLCTGCCSAMHQSLMRIGVEYVLDLLPGAAVATQPQSEFKH